MSCESDLSNISSKSNIIATKITNLEAIASDSLKEQKKQTLILQELFKIVTGSNIDVSSVG